MKFLRQIQIFRGKRIIYLIAFLCFTASVPLFRSERKAISLIATRALIQFDTFESCLTFLAVVLTSLFGRN